MGTLDNRHKMSVKANTRSPAGLPALGWGGCLQGEARGPGDDCTEFGPECSGDFMPQARIKVQFGVRQLVPQAQCSLVRYQQVILAVDQCCGHCDLWQPFGEVRHLPDGFTLAGYPGLVRIPIVHLTGEEALSGFIVVIGRGDRVPVAFQEDLDRFVTGPRDDDVPFEDVLIDVLDRGGGVEEHKSGHHFRVVESDMLGDQAAH